MISPFRELKVLCGLMMIVVNVLLSSYVIFYSVSDTSAYRYVSAIQHLFDVF